MPPADITLYRVDGKARREATGRAGARVRRLDSTSSRHPRGLGIGLSILPTGVVARARSPAAIGAIAGTRRSQGTYHACYPRAAGTAQLRPRPLGHTGARRSSKRGPSATRAAGCEGSSLTMCRQRAERGFGRAHTLAARTGARAQSATLAFALPAAIGRSGARGRCKRGTHAGGAAESGDVSLRPCGQRIEGARSIPRARSRAVRGAPKARPWQSRCRPGPVALVPMQGMSTPSVRIG